MDTHARKWMISPGSPARWRVQRVAQAAVLTLLLACEAGCGGGGSQAADPSAVSTVVNASTVTTIESAGPLISARAAGTTNSRSIEMAIAGMQATAEAVGLGMSGAKARGGIVAQGLVPEQRSTPDYWSPDNTSPAYGGTWHWMQPWFHFFATDATVPGNWRIATRGYRLMVQRRSTRAWEIVPVGDEAQADYYVNEGQNALGNAPARRNGAADEWKLPGDGSRPEIHGYPAGHSLDPWLGDIANLAFSMQTRLVPDVETGPDERARARVVVTVGVDYLPWQGLAANALGGLPYFPSAGGTAPMLVQSEWREHVFFPLATAGAIESTIGNVSLAERTVTESAFRANPPPFTLPQ